MERIIGAGNALQTATIQQAIDECYLAGGGKIVLAPGLHPVGGLRLRSNCTLYLQSGAILKGTRNPADYNILAEDRLEPLPDAYRSDAVWAPARTRKNADHITKAGTGWNNAIIRVLDAHDAAVIGEPGSVIDGSDCYDEIGEEHYRGPHGIACHHSHHLTFRGYTIRNTGNWAHLAFTCQDLTFADLEIEAGHDGIHLSVCDRISVTHCNCYTGDDCIAGFDNYDMTVRDCELNTACSAFRFGGADILIENCRMFGPARHFFRGSLSLEDKISGNPAPATGRKTMLAAFTYYSDFTLTVRRAPRNIVMRDCTAEECERFLFYDFSGKQVWQANRPLEEITFERVTAKNIAMPLDLYGDPQHPHTVTLRHCAISFGEPVIAAMRAAHYGKIEVTDTAFGNVSGTLVRSFGDSGEIVMQDVTGVAGERALADETYVSKFV